MEIREIIAQLKQPFPVEAHKERKLPGGGRWFFIPWQLIRDRLDEVYPEWQVSWSQPEYLGENCIIICTITIAGISRSAPGNAPINATGWGTPVERAIADAFKNSSESFGVARYLDNQDFVVSYLKNKGDMRGYKFAQENAEIEAGARGTQVKKPEKNGLLEALSAPSSVSIISENQRKRFWAIARGELKLEDGEIKSVLAEFGLDSSSAIPVKDYEKIVGKMRSFAVSFK
jgi:hypothetical protein